MRMTAAIAIALLASTQVSHAEDSVCGTGQITRLQYSLTGESNGLNLGFSMTSQPAAKDFYYHFGTADYIYVRYSDGNRFRMMSDTLMQAFENKMSVRILSKNKDKKCLMDDQSIIISVCLQNTDKVCQ